MGRTTRSVGKDEPLEVTLELEEEKAERVLYAHEVIHPERIVQGVGTFRRGEPVKIDPKLRKSLEAKGMTVTTGRNLPKETT